MGEEKSNQDKENKKKQKSINDDVASHSDKRILDIISEQIMKLTGGISLNQTLSDTAGITGAAGTTVTGNDSNIRALADKVLSINILRFELDRLQLDFKARAYFENDVRPLIDTLTVLSFASDNFSSTASNIASTNFGRTSNIKDALDLAEDVDEISEDLIKVLKCKIDNMLKLSKYDCK